MPLRRLLAAGIWLVVTVGLTATVWAATSIVAADVTDSPAEVVAHNDVVTELESGSAGAGATTSSTTPPAETPSSTAPPRRRVPAPATTVAPAPPAPAPQPSPPTTTVPAAVTPPSAPPTTPPTSQPPPSHTATYTTAGGAATVRCNGFLTALISAIPSSGYAVNVVTAGPVNVDVHFVGFGQDLSVKAVCFGDPIRYYDQTPPRPAQGSS